MSCALLFIRVWFMLCIRVSRYGKASYSSHQSSRPVGLPRLSSWAVHAACVPPSNIAHCAELRDATQLCRLGLGRVCMRVRTGCDRQYGQH